MTFFLKHAKYSQAFLNNIKGVMKSKRKKPDREPKRRTPYQIVKDLPLGPGKGLLITKKGKRTMVNHGRVVKVNGVKVLQSLKKPFSQGNKSSFADGTRVRKWQQLVNCDNCSSQPTCNGFCVNL